VTTQGISGQNPIRPLSMKQAARLYANEMSGISDFRILPWKRRRPLSIAIQRHMFYRACSAGRARVLSTQHGHLVVTMKFKGNARALAQPQWSRAEARRAAFGWALTALLFPLMTFALAVGVAQFAAEAKGWPWDLAVVLLWGCAFLTTPLLLLIKQYGKARRRVRLPKDRIMIVGAASTGGAQVVQVLPNLLMSANAAIVFHTFAEPFVTSLQSSPLRSRMTSDRLSVWGQYRIIIQ
jgi:hypothetical protein